MPTYKVQGAALNYEIFGSGPLLVLIPGAQGSGSIFHDTAKYLAAHFTVVCWDRRGFSQSLLIGAQDYSNRLSTDADDLHSLITLLGSPAFVFGTSSGAIVATRLLERHPESVKALIAHEPPSFAVLPEEQKMQAIGLTDHIYSVYREKGVAAAIEIFSGGLFKGDEGDLVCQAMDTTRGDEIRANAMYWLERELRQYPSSPVNLNIVSKQKEKYIPAAGVASGYGPGVAPVALIAGLVGKDIVRFPGGHLGYQVDPKGFADAFYTVLTGV